MVAFERTYLAIVQNTNITQTLIENTCTFQLVEEILYWQYGQSKMAWQLHCIQLKHELPVESKTLKTDF